MVKAIIFDCFGVFYTDPVFAHMRNPKTSKAEADALHNLDKQAALGLLSKQGFKRQAATLLGDTPENIERRFFVGHDRNEQLVSFVKAIRKDYKTALLSNIGSDMMDGFFNEHTYGELFDEVILSGAVKLAKPDPAIFKLACERLEVTLSEAMMVDDMQTTIDAVRRLGMKGICYENFTQFKTDLKKSS